MNARGGRAESGNTCCRARSSGGASVTIGSVIVGCSAKSSCAAVMMRAASSSSGISKIGVSVPGPPLARTACQ